MEYNIGFVIGDPGGDGGHPGDAGAVRCAAEEAPGRGDGEQPDQGGGVSPHGDHRQAGAAHQP